MVHDHTHTRETIRLRCQRGWFSLYASNDLARTRPLVEECIEEATAAAALADGSNLAEQRPERPEESEHERQPGAADPPMASEQVEGGLCATLAQEQQRHRLDLEAARQQERQMDEASEEAEQPSTAPADWNVVESDDDET